jgi:hypothetical protein
VATTARKLGQGNGGVHKQAGGELGWAEGRRFAQAGRILPSKARPELGKVKAKQSRAAA